MRHVKRFGKLHKFGAFGAPFIVIAIGTAIPYLNCYNAAGSTVARASFWIAIAVGTVCFFTLEFENFLARILAVVMYIPLCMLAMLPASLLISCSFGDCL